MTMPKSIGWFCYISRVVICAYRADERHGNCAGLPHEVRLRVFSATES
jgi:hypothetical protein